MSEITQQNVGLAIDSIDGLTLHALVGTFAERIGYLVSDTPENLRDTERLELVTTIRNKAELKLVLDTQLSGGLGALVDRTELNERLFHPDFMTVSYGITLNGLRSVVSSAKRARVLTTGVLPDIARTDLGTSGSRNADPRDITIDRALLARDAGADGIYGSAYGASNFNWKEVGLEYFAVGISPDGLPYADKHAENVTRMSEAFNIGATVVIVGSSLYESRFGAPSFESNNTTAIDRRLELFDMMLRGVVPDVDSRVQ